MKLSVTDKAAQWYKSELSLSNGDTLRFFVRYGGSSPIQKGFSLGLIQDIPSEKVIKTEEAGITFFIEEEDLWYFDQHNLEIGFNDKMDEPEFIYQ